MRFCSLERRLVWAFYNGIAILALEPGIDSEGPAHVPER